MRRRFRITQPLREILRIVIIKAELHYQRNQVILET